jgi:hypothetical protein
MLRHLLIEHCLVEVVADDPLQEIADQPCRAALAHRPRGLTRRLQHVVAEWQRFVWQRLSILILGRAGSWWRREPAPAAVAAGSA